MGARLTAGIYYYQVGYWSRSLENIARVFYTHSAFHQKANFSCLFTTHCGLLRVWVAFWSVLERHVEVNGGLVYKVECQLHGVYIFCLCTLYDLWCVHILPFVCYMPYGVYIFCFCTLYDLWCVHILPSYVIWSREKHLSHSFTYSAFVRYGAFPEGFLPTPYVL